MTETIVRRGCTFALAAAVGLFATLAATRAGAQDQTETRPVKLQPHRAVYEITLGRSSVGAGVSQLTGRMVYELSGSQCAGFTQKMRMVTRTSGNQGQTSVSDLRSTFFEAAASKSFRFETENFRDKRLTEVTRGSAQFGKAGAEDAGKRQLRIRLVEPSNKDLSISTNALFPIAHSVALIKAAQSGERLFSVDLYDGSDKGDKIYATTAAIGALLTGQEKGALPKVGDTAKLLGLEAWPVSLSYFEKDNTGDDAAPTYELSFIFFANGVSRRLEIDYGAFAIKGRLSQLTFLKEKPCK